MKDLSVKSQLDLENNKILNGTTDTPTSPESIVNKEYVDKAIDNVHPIFISSLIMDLPLGTDYSVQTFINNFYGDDGTTHTIDEFKQDLDKIYSGCPVTVAFIDDTQSEVSNVNVYLKKDSSYFCGYSIFRLSYMEAQSEGIVNCLWLRFPKESTANINYIVCDRFSTQPMSYETDIDTVPTSTSSAKKIMDRLNSINITGDVYKGSATINHTDNTLTIDTYRRNAVVGIEADLSKPWFKFASITLNNAYYQDTQISFLVNSAYGDSTQNIGILTAHFRTDTKGKMEGAQLTWSLCGNNINLDNFVLAYNNANPCIVELWCKCYKQYIGYHFIVLAENTRREATIHDWKLTQSWNEGGQTQITSGYTQVVSSLITLKNNINTRPFQKLSPDTISDFSITENTTNKDLNTAEYLKPGTFRVQLNTIAATLTNCPTKTAFIMYVGCLTNQGVDTESVTNWVYRWREIRDVSGNFYYQTVTSGSTGGQFTFGDWINLTKGGSGIDSKVDKSDLGITTFKVTRDASTSSNAYGYWASMARSDQTGSPKLPSTGKWWHLLSMDWHGTTNNNTSWISQLALPTNDGGVPHYRRNDTAGTAIDSSTWHSFITDENISTQSVGSATKAAQDSDGNKINATYLKLSGGTMTGSISSSLSGTHLQGNEGTNVLINSIATSSQYQTLYRKKSTNGVFTINGWSDNILLGYTSDSIISNKQNTLSNAIKYMENGSLIPFTNNTQDIGSSTTKWKNIYATTFTGNLSGNASTASSATKLTTARKINTVEFDGTKDITITANPTQNALSANVDLNTIKTYGEYYCAGRNTVTNKPTGVDSFGLKVFRTADSYLRQELSPNLSGTPVKYNRTWNGSTWSEWELQATDEVTIDSKTPTKNTIELWVDTSEIGSDFMIKPINNLTSTSTTDALSAYQGKVLNDTKLNIPVTLYNNTSGTNGTVTLSQTVANFSYLKIFFSGTNTGDVYTYSSVEIHNPNNKRVRLQTGYIGSEYFYYDGSRVTISNTSITINRYGHYKVGSPGIVDYELNVANYIYIYKVLGYR